MGLDMYAYRTKEFVDDDNTQIKDEKEIAYWRKHNRLHGWFEEQYKVESNAFPNTSKTAN